MIGTRVLVLATALFAGTGGVAADEARGKVEGGIGGWVERIDEVIEVEEGGTLVLRLDRGGIEVDSELRKGVRVVVEKSADVFTEAEARRVLEDYSVDLRREGNDVRVTGKSLSDRRTRSLEVSARILVPPRYSVDLETGGGGISVGDLGGSVAARTSGGGIEVGRIRNGSVVVHTAGGGIGIAGIDGGDGQAETSGGGISVGDVTGNLRVRTAGGGIEIGDVGGDVDAETAGGGIAIGRGGAAVTALTAGGGIEVKGSGGRVAVKTSGGGIAVEDAGGPVEATTSGGGIRVRGAAGPVAVRTAGGGITVEGVRGAIEASTAGGGITAELVLADPDADTHCTLETAGGDVVLRLPADLQATIDAEIQLDGARRDYGIASDFPLEIDDGARRITARGTINGGGDLIRLRTTNGDIEIRKR